MDPATAFAIGSAVIGGAGSFFGQRSANKANKRAAQESMQFQERMSSTAYQRAVADKRAAGINPLFGLGTGASSPGGAMASAQNELQGASSTALDIARARAELKNLDIQNDKIRSDIAVNKVMEQVLTKDVQVKRSTANKIDQEIERGSYDASIAKAKDTVVSSLLPWWSRQIEEIGEVMSGKRHFWSGKKK